MATGDAQAGDAGREVLHLGGMTLKRRVGGVDIEPVGGGGSVRIQDADMAEVAAFLTAAAASQDAEWRKRMTALGHDPQTLDAAEWAAENITAATTAASHRQWPGGDVCVQCRSPWPCPTARASSDG